MYKLYGYIPELKFLKASFDERTIIEEINKYIYNVEYIHFMVVLQTEDRMMPYRLILTEQEFLDYIDDYRKENGIGEENVFRNKSLSKHKKKRK